jgi:hypothetical protein
MGDVDTRLEFAIIAGADRLVSGRRVNGQFQMKDASVGFPACMVKLY